MTTEKADAYDHLEAGYTVDEAEQILPEPIDTSHFIHVGADACETARRAPEPEWLVRDYLRKGTATILGGSTMSAKTRNALQVGSSLAAGVPVWPGADESTDPGVVVYIGFDPHMSIEGATRRLGHLDLWGGAEPSTSACERSGPSEGCWRRRCGEDVAA